MPGTGIVPHDESSRSVLKKSSGRWSAFSTQRNFHVPCNERKREDFVMSPFRASASFS